MDDGPGHGFDVYTPYGRLISEIKLSAYAADVTPLVCSLQLPPLNGIASNVVLGLRGNRQRYVTTVTGEGKRRPPLSSSSAILAYENTRRRKASARAVAW